MRRVESMRVSGKLEPDSQSDRAGFTQERILAMLTYDDLLTRFIAWAEEAPTVRSAMILGSRARSDHPADEWSDLDVLVFAAEPDSLIRESTWATRLAPHWLTFVERTGDGSAWERRTLYEGGLDVDVAVFPAAGLAALDAELPPALIDVIRRGVRILVDKDGVLSRVVARPLPSIGLYKQPSEAEFVNLVSDFWYHTLWSAKHWRRGELWWAKSGIDGALKNQLHRMLEWHARATRGADFDTWLRGRFLEEWADPRAVAALPGIFGRYDRADLASALEATMKLYRWLEDETAERWGYTPPRDGELRAATATEALLAARPWHNPDD